MYCSPQETEKTYNESRTSRKKHGKNGFPRNTLSQNSEKREVKQTRTTKES